MIEFSGAGRAFGLTADGRLVRIVREERPVSAAQAAMLRMLLARAGRQASEAELAQAAWGEDGSQDAVEAVMRGLAAALGDDPACPLLIEALPQRGYRLLVSAAEAAGRADAPPPDAASVIRALCEARAEPAAAPFLEQAGQLGAANGLGPDYDRAVQMLHRAAQAGRGDALPALALETVIDGLQAVA